MISKALNAKSGILLIAALEPSAMVVRDRVSTWGLPGDAARRSPKLWDSAQTDSCASSTPPAIAACLRAISQRWHAAPYAVSCAVRAVRGAGAVFRSRRDLGARVDLRADSLFSSATEDGHPVTRTFGGRLALNYVVAGSPGGAHEPPEAPSSLPQPQNHSNRLLSPSHRPPHHPQKSRDTAALTTP